MDYNQQILSSLRNNSCCSLAFLNAVTSCAQINLNSSKFMIGANPLVLEKFISILSKSYPNLEINLWDNFLQIGGDLTNFFEEINFNSRLNLSNFTNECDRLTILKTFFLFYGRFYYNKDNSKNSKGYNLEFVLKDEFVAKIIIELLKEFNFELKLIKRQSNYVIYTKNSSIISDLFVILGAGYTALNIQNDLAIREMRNNANRQNNCFESNLEKTLDASALQLQAINYIINNYSIDYLSENLREVALARIANPEISLGELKVLMGNQISRSGIKYRLDKIIEIYEKLKSSN